MLKIISGGQTGVDRGALDAARELDVEFGGWCPAGRLAEDGRIPKGYRLLEMPTPEYAARTAANVRDSDGTLIICKGEPSGGTRATLECCRRFEKRYLVIDCGELSLKEAIERVIKFVRELPSLPRDPFRLRRTAAQQATSLGMTLNVAGPRASQWPQGREIARQIISAVLRRFSGHEGRDEYISPDSPRGEF